MTTGSISDAPPHARAFSHRSFAVPPLPKIDASKIAPKINVFRCFRPLFPKVLALMTGRHARRLNDVVGLFVGSAGTRFFTRRCLPYGPSRVATDDDGVCGP